MVINTKMGTLKDQLKKLKKSALIGLVGSVTVTLLWFVLFSSRNVRTLGLSIFGAAVVIFVLKIAYDFVIEKMGITKKFLANELFILFALIAFLATTICAFAPVMLFASVHNERAEKRLNAYAANGNIEELSYETVNGTLHGWFLHNAQGSAPTVLYFCGNGEDAAGRVLQLLENENICSVFSGYHFACVDYPGYGNSEGVSSEESFKNMGLSAYDCLMNRDDVNNITLMGYSLGTGVANYVASERQPAGLILMAPYADGYDLYNSYVNIFHGPLKALVSFKMKSVKFAEKVNVKPLLLASNMDEQVPYESSVELFKQYKKGCNFVTIDEIGHNDFWETQEVLDEIEKYLKQ